jgi:hypothetical protein
MQPIALNPADNVLKRNVYESPKHTPIGIALLAISAVAIVLGALALHGALVKGSPFASIAKAIPLPASGTLLGLGAITLALGVYFCANKKKSEALVVDEEKGKFLATDLEELYVPSGRIFKEDEAEDLLEAHNELIRVQNDFWKTVRYFSNEQLAEKIQESDDSFFDLMTAFRTAQLRLAVLRSEITGEDVDTSMKVRAYSLPDHYKGESAEEYRRFYSLFIDTNTTLLNESIKIREMASFLIEMERTEKNLKINFQDIENTVQENCAKLQSFVSKMLLDLGDVKTPHLQDLRKQRSLLKEFRINFDKSFIVARVELRRWCRLIENKKGLEPLSFEDANYAAALEDYYLEDDTEFETYTVALDKLVWLRDTADELFQKEELLERAVSYEGKEWQEIAGPVGKNLQFLSQHIDTILPEILEDKVDEVWFDLMALRKHLEAKHQLKGFQEWKTLNRFEENQSIQEVGLFNVLYDHFTRVA